ncbi:MAG TPA: hypothetical protein VGX71_13690 [Pseudaminobacter sp.]|nr:hypothetical protein [Pseudaminobacter sp.]
MKPHEGTEPGLPSCFKVEATAGGFEVTENGVVVGGPGGPFDTNAAAWQFVDRLTGDRVPKRKKRRLRKSADAPPMSAKARRKMLKDAAKAPGWVRAGVAAVFDPAGAKAYRDFKLGTLGPASPVRRIDPAQYLAEKENC